MQVGGSVGGDAGSVENAGRVMGAGVRDEEMGWVEVGSLRGYAVESGIGIVTVRLIQLGGVLVLHSVEQRGSTLYSLCRRGSALYSLTLCIKVCKMLL